MFFIKKGSAFTNKMHYLCQHSEVRKLYFRTFLEVVNRKDKVLVVKPYLI